MGRRRSRGRAVNGIVLLDKPGGITSNRALQRVKRLYDASKAGHTGSLDPLASGMLPLCLGQATKVSGWLLDADKSYEFEVAFGSRTATADADGEVVETCDRTTVSEAELMQAVAGLRGPIRQVPPMYSALKQGGRRLYELARAGEEVHREAREVTIHELELLTYDPQRPRFRVRCSKGTYVRTLAEDLAAAAGTLAHVTMLRRITAGPFDPADMVSLEQLEALEGDYAALDSLLLPLDAALQAMPAVHLGAAEAFYMRNGQAVNAGAVAGDGPVRVYGPDNVLLAVGDVLDDGRVAPRRQFRLSAAS